MTFFKVLRIFLLYGICSQTVNTLGRLVIIILLRHNTDGASFATKKQTTKADAGRNDEYLMYMNKAHTANDASS